jgi:hemoglobin/transferrin/lactoferrin receptor protein
MKTKQSLHSNDKSMPYSKAVTPSPRLIVLALALAFAGATSFISLVPHAAHAQETVAERSYSISAGKLSDVLARFAAAAGVPLSFDPKLLDGMQSDGLEGLYTVQEGFSVLLTNSGYELVSTGAGGYSLRRISGDITSLPAVKISASSIASTQTTVGYSRDEIEALQPQDMKDLFRRESAVSVGGSIPVNQKVYVRGVEETAMLVTVDGARQNNKVFHHNATNLIDPALLKAVRASAGVAAADDGPGALGGSLVYETVDVADVLDPGRSLGGFVNSQYASNGDQVTTAGSLYGRRSGFEFLGYLNHTDGNDYENGDGDTVRHTAPGLLSGLGKIAYENGQVGRFELSHEHVNDEADRPYRANFVGLTAGRPVPESRVYDLTRRNTSFNYSRETGSGYWNPSVTIARSETELDTRERPLSDPSRSIVYTGITESVSATAKNTLYASFADITAGFDYYDDSAVFQFSGDPDLEEEAENMGAFIQFRQPLGDRINLSYGLRYDRQDFTGTDDSRHDDSGVSGNLFGEVRLNDYITLNAGYAEVWGGAALAENFILNGDWSYTGLKAVEASNHTLGIRGQFNGFVAEANTYRTRIDNGRTPSWGGGAELVADFDIDGYDLSFGYIGSRGEINLKYANIESEKDGEPATSYDGNYFTVPLGELITVSGVLDFPALRLSLGLNAEVALDNDDIESSGAEQEGYTVVNLYADYALLEHLSLRFAVDNLTDDDYTDRASYGQEFTTVKPLLEPGRSFVVSARYSF